MVIGRIDWKRIFELSDFWAVQIAKQGIERAKRKNKEIVTVRCANTPTGVLHIGNANDVIRAYFIAKSVEALGFNSRLVFTSDDRDPIRGFPPIICDKNGNLMEFPENLKEEWTEKYDGQPVSMIPDPFKCHSSWSEHFLSVYFKELEQLGIVDSIKFEYYSPNVLYFQGEWDKYVEIVLKEKEKVKKIFEEFKEHVREYAFSPICRNCGKIGTTHVTSYDPEKKIVRYYCGSRRLKKKTVEGCGYEGENTIREGKVDWYIEWAINWAYFDTDIEPMGKDHYNSSWRISPVFAKELFGIEPPIPVPYEFFLVDGKKMSGSKGNVYNLTELLKMLEPEVILYFYTKRPMQQRNLDLKNLNILVNEWDRLESKVYDVIEMLRREKIKVEEVEEYGVTYEDLAIYYLCNNGKIPERKPIRISYGFAAVIGQLIKEGNEIKKLLIRTGHISEDISYKEFDNILKRIEKAKYWARKYGPDYIRVSLNPGKVSLDSKERELFKKILDYLENLVSIDPERIQKEIYEIIKSSGLNIKEIYRKFYKMLLNKEKGPRIGTLIAVIGKEKVIEIIKEEI